MQEYFLGGGSGQKLNVRGVGLQVMKLNGCGHQKNRDTLPRSGMTKRKKVAKK